MKNQSLVLLLLVLAGCPAEKIDDSGAADAAITIQDIQTGEVADGTTGVQLRGIVVTTPFTIEGEGFYIQEQGGGEYSGIYVYTGGPFETLKLQVGDLIDIYGAVSEYYDFTELVVDTERAIQVLGSAEPAVDTLSSTPSDWELWESCLVKLPDQTAVSGLNNWGEVELSSGISMDNVFVDFKISEGDDLGDVTGVMSYNFELFKINPRTGGDIENGPGEALTTTVTDIQDGTVSEGESVVLEDVVACSDLSSGDEGFFVQDQGGGEYSGIYVFLGDSSSLGVTIGDLLDLSGVVTEYYDMTELSSSDDRITPTGGTGTCTPAVLDSTPADWEPYECVLVTLENVEITSDPDSHGEIGTNYGINIDDWFHDMNASSGDTFTSVTGLVLYSYDTFKLCPRASSDVTP